MGKIYGWHEMNLFLEGFFTASIIGVVWYMVHQQQHPRPRGRVGVVVQDSKSKKPTLIRLGMRIESDDPAYEKEIHIAPDTDEEDAFPLGVHDFTLLCHCHPEVRKVQGQTLILHFNRNA